MDDPEGAIVNLEAAAQVDPSRSHPWGSLATIYQDLSRPDDLLRVTCAELETAPGPERELVLHARAAALWIERDGERDRACSHFERLLELEPGRADATEFLVDRYEEQGRYADVVRLLEGRLGTICGAEGEEACDDASRGLVSSLRLRMATLQAEELNDPEAAIVLLEAALAGDGPTGAATEPLAELYESTERRRDLVDLCKAAAEACRASDERALWLRRMASSLQEMGEDNDAIEAYRQVLEARPNDLEVRKELCDLYRRGDHAAPLVELLTDSLSGISSVEEVPIRMELARLLEDGLSRPAEALAQLQRVFELEADHDVAFRHAVDLAHRMERHDTEAQLVENRLERCTSLDERIALLERRAGLLAGPLGAPEAAASAYREVISLAPQNRSARRSLREVLESLGRWAAVLDCLYVDAEGAGPQEQAAIYEHAVEIATAHVGQDAALPWLERLRSVRPDDALIIARIADVHRMAGRFESVLRALEDELALTRDPRHQRDLHVGRARILERDMDAPGRAIRALEAARALFPQDSEVLEKLDELYGVTARARERAEVIEARLPGCSDDDRLRLHLAAADLYADPLTEPLRAVPHLLRAVSLTGAGEGATQAALPSTPEARCALLSDLASTLGAAGWQEARARAAEAELSLLRNDLSERGPEEDDPRVTRRNRLHLDLARAYADQLANPNAAMAHLRAGMAYADEDDSAGLRPEDLDWMESRLLDLLRQDANFVELEERLATRVGRGGGDADEWLELARLRDERLCSPSAARDAYAQALALRSSCLPAIRGLRDLSERLGDWREVARTLELELQLEGSSNRDRDDLERAALSRRLGDVCWRRIHAEDRAIEAYRDALASNPADLDSLRSLQQLHESREEFDAAAGLHEREAEILGDSEPERRREVWLSAAELVRKLGDDPQRALHAYEEAASLSPLDAQPLRVQADLYAELGRHSDFAATYASWCDLDESGATCGEHLLLVDTLIELGRPDDAIARCQHAIEVDDESPDAWATLAQLQQDQDHDGEAGDAWQRAGELRQGPEAATHLCTAALLVETSDRDLCAERLRSALERDPASAQGHAHLARVACALAKWAEAEDAAVRALDLAAAPSDENVDEALQLATALAGGRAARALDRLESAGLFYGAALDLDPANRDALEAYGELLFERGDLAAARGALEARLEMDPDDRQAERLAMLGSVLELVDEPEAALARFREAIAADETCGAAQAGVARLCANAGHVDEAVEALAGWAEACRSADDLRGCGARYLRAADLELSQEGAEAARAHLHASIEAYPENARAWVLLAELHAEADQPEDVLRLAPEALGVDAVQALPDAVARLSLLYARALERRDEPAKACDAYSIAVDHDSRCSEAALARARLQRMQGEWQEAADGLRAFSDRHPEPDHRDLSEIQYKLARLLAGPLEDMAGAIRCFERALEIAPDHPKARGPLASLLAVMPERWEQAIAQHSALLQDDPTQATSLRGLLKIVSGRGDTEAAGPGLAVLRAMGAASPSERDEAPGCLPTAVVVTPALADPAEELARRLIQHASEALDQVLQTPSGDDPSGTAEGFVARRDHALRELSAAGLERFSDEELGDLIAILAAFAMGDGEDVHMSHGQLDPSVAEGIDRALGRWTRRKMRRVLDGGSPEQIQMIDPGHFRRALRGLAASVAVDLGHGDLREALVALSIDRDAPAPSDTDDLTNPVSACEDACELLRYVTTSWCAQLVGS
jgi:tetratricopeptide (TPR) repeat protein